MNKPRRYSAAVTHDKLDKPADRAISVEDQIASANARKASWSRFVLPNGLVAFHDQSAPGVRQLFGQFVRKGQLLSAENVEAVSWFKSMRE